ncbi:MAG: hypothetical protein V1912_00065 [bacterium]
MEPQFGYDSIKRAAVSAALNGDNAIVAAVTGKKIRVLALHVSAAGAVNGKLRSDVGAGGSDITGLHTFAGAGSEWDMSTLGYGWCETDIGEALNLNLSGGVAVAGVVVYAEV